MKLFSVLLCLGLAACASSTRTTLVIEDAGALYLRDLASDSRMPSGSTDVSLSGQVPVSGVLTPFTALLQGSGMQGTHTVIIRRVTGPIVIERALSNSQGVDLPAALERLFQPGDPFGSTLIENQSYLREGK